MSKKDEVGSREHWDDAFGLHQKGRLREALSLYDAILRADPRHAAALHYSGVALYQTGTLGGFFWEM
jgi:hypothetical protein